MHQKGPRPSRPLYDLYEYAGYIQIRLTSAFENKMTTFFEKVYLQYGPKIAHLSFIIVVSFSLIYKS